MKPATPFREHLPNPPPGPVLAMGLALLLCSHSAAQSAANFDTQDLTPASKTEKKEKAAPAVEAGPVSASPSRLVGEADLAPYVQSLSAVFSIRNRATDPFGQYQDPNAKPIIKAVVAKRPTRAAPVQITPFADIIRMIKVTTIMPGEDRFLVGTRSFSIGDRIPLLFRGKNINVEVVSVTSLQIEFRNLETGESAPLKMNLLPAGMTPGTKGITAPGMVPDRKDAPLDLDNGEYQATSQNR